jgi:Zn-dependent membrane protease YugP
MFFDPVYIIFLLPALLLSLFASILVKLWTNAGLSKPNSTNINGFDVVQKVVTKYNLNISLSRTPDTLSDHYDPSNNNLVLSREIETRPTIASVAIAAHELGHARQDHNKSLLLKTRSLVVPMVNIGTNLGYIFIVIGLLISLSSLAWVGILFFSFSVLFSLLTLPIEIDASNKALQMIRELELLDKSEITGAKKVLSAAALTYVAATINSILNLAYFVFRAKGIKED